MLTLIKGGYVVDPGSGIEGNYDILIKDEYVCKVLPKSDINEADIKADKIIDASGMTVMPGLIDLHVHLREPGFEYKETTTRQWQLQRRLYDYMCVNTVLDRSDTIQFVLDRLRKLWLIFTPLEHHRSGRKERPTYRE